jgi:hypothetical protein
MPTDHTISTIAHVIQMAVAPVFLLSAISALLAVLTNRLGRIIDRARVVEGYLANRAQPMKDAWYDEIRALFHRMRQINFAITLCTIAALLICLVIVSLFLGSFLNTDFSRVIIFLFIVAMVALIGGLLSFLKEIFTATRSAYIEMPDFSPE